MATATARKPRSKKTAPQKTVLNVACEFSSLSIGEGTARLGIRIKRAHLNLLAADEALCGRRITGRVVICPEDVDFNQTTFLDDAEYCVAGVFDVKRIGVAPLWITCGLTFSLADIDVEDLAHFPKKTGRFLAELVQALEDVADDDDEEAGDE